MGGYQEVDCKYPADTPSAQYKIILAGIRSVDFKTCSGLFYF